MLETKPPITPIISKNPRDRYLADLVDLRRYSERNSGYSWVFISSIKSQILVVIDSFSKFAMVEVATSKNSEEIVNLIGKIFYTNGPPLILHTDNGKEFKNSKMVKFCEDFGTKHVFGRPRAPWVQGQVERYNFSIHSIDLISRLKDGCLQQVRQKEHLGVTVCNSKKEYS
ncbi:uncharacterized protein LOC115227152 [Octopus sinensis]|uniref:Uncharacterized protein LOC115227152 n=1 Tax=Octopus sinensis TaxID=2607531 RepID=A0A6P7TP50_9MOLL|nr:uncharacterized protein LOC115227152 [Octopus sinensis]